MTADDPFATPEGRLIRRAREGAIPKLSIRAAASRIGISPEHWGNVERGYKSVSAGQQPLPVVADAALLAKMAEVVRLTAAEMRDEGQRPDAAERMGTSIRANPPPRRFRTSPEMQRDMAPYEPGILRLVVRAQREHRYAEYLTGDMVFDPEAWDGTEDDRARLAAIWDQIAKIEPDPERTAQLVAAWLAWEDQAAHEQGGAASGLALAGGA